MRITDKINFRQPKYMLPAIVYIPLIATGYFVFDMFNTEVAETQDKNLQTTEDPLTAAADTTEENTSPVPGRSWPTRLVLGKAVCSPSATTFII